MELLPESKQLSVTYLLADGVFTKRVSLANLVPMIYDDYRVSAFSTPFHIARCIDTEMIYYNLFDSEFYLMDQDAEWNEETAQHPELQLAKNFDERKWLDAVQFV